MRIALLTVVLLAASLPTVAQTFTFTTIDIPGAVRTTVSGINNGGDMVGYYSDGGQNTHGFYFDAGHAKFRKLDLPNSQVNAAYGINDAREIVGTNFLSIQNGYRFFNNKFRLLNLGAAANYAAGVNTQGAVVGLYLDVCCDAHGYLLQAGQLTTLDYPLGVSSTAIGLNDSSLVVGVWTDNAGIQHGFQWDAGTYTAIDVPGATKTYAFGINSQNTIAGYYTDSAGSDHGFLLSNGSYTTVDMPGVRSTRVLGINNSGMLVGQYTLNGKVHGFVAAPSA
jgi:hypothetical protein